MRDPETVAYAQRAAARLEAAWEQWRAAQGLATTPAQPVVGYVGYALKEPWGQPRAVIGFSADEAERLAEHLERTAQPTEATAQPTEKARLAEKAGRPLASPKSLEGSQHRLSTGSGTSARLWDTGIPPDSRPQSSGLGTARPRSEPRPLPRHPGGTIFLHAWRGSRPHTPRPPERPDCAAADKTGRPISRAGLRPYPWLRLR
jgi:hypothetical protein